MKRIIAICFFFALSQSPGFSQNQWLDSLKHELQSSQGDTLRVRLLNRIGEFYMFNRPDSGINYSSQALALARAINHPQGEVVALRQLAFSLRELGNYPTATQVNLKALKLAERHDLSHDKGLTYGQMGLIYHNAGNYKEAVNSLMESKGIFDSIPAPDFSVMTKGRLINTYLSMGQYDSALYYAKVALDELAVLQNKWPQSGVYVSVGQLYKEMGNHPMAIKYFQNGIQSPTIGAVAYYNLAQIQKNLNNVDSSIYYVEKSLEAAQTRGSYPQIIDAYRMMADIYESQDPDQANEYNRLALAYKDSLELIGKTVALETFIEFDEQERQQELAAAEAEFQSRLRINAFLGGSFTLIVIALLLYRSNRAKHKSKQRIEKAYHQLKATQTQLIQSEKMASLGELTAGIAHEIQNPLNFVNNFSEVSTELIDEMSGEIEAGNLADVKEITSDLKQNLEKIHHHGQRASGIVKGMLEHSRTGDGVQEPTDINALADEYVRLAYHGLRAKDKSFQADFTTNLDPSLPKINVVPQDIGRVFLNLINNAFYAVDKKAKAGMEDYKPEVIVSTILIPSGEGEVKVQISVKDNALGIPVDIKDKIFQPFFTTKPTGSGTGLGLSLSYDIVKAHGGAIEVESSEGEGTEFIISLPFVGITPDP